MLNVQIDISISESRIKADAIPETVNRYAEELIFNIHLTEVLTTLSVAKAAKQDGKGNPYIDVINMHVPMRDTVQIVSRRAFAKALLKK